MKLYYSPQSCSMAVYLTLELARANYEAIKVQIGSEDFKKIAPKGAVPAFQDGGSDIMTQNHAILKYIVNKHPESNLGSDGSAAQEYELDNALSFISGDLHPSYWNLFAAIYSDDEAAKEVLTQNAHRNLARHLGYLNEMLEGKDYLVLNKLTIADFLAYIVAGWAINMYPTGLQDFPNVLAHQEKIYNIAEVKHIMDTYNN